MKHHVSALLPDSLASYFGVLKWYVFRMFFSKNKHIKKF